MSQIVEDCFPIFRESFWFWMLLLTFSISHHGPTLSAKKNFKLKICKRELNIYIQFCFNSDEAKKKLQQFYNTMHKIYVGSVDKGRVYIHFRI